MFLCFKFIENNFLSQIKLKAHYDMLIRKNISSFSVKWVSCKKVNMINFVSKGL